MVSGVRREGKLGAAEIGNRPDGCALSTGVGARPQQFVAGLEGMPASHHGQVFLQAEILGHIDVAAFGKAAQTGCRRPSSEKLGKVSRPTFGMPSWPAQF